MGRLALSVMRPTMRSPTVRGRIPIMDGGSLASYDVARYQYVSSKSAEG